MQVSWLSITNVTVTLSLVLVSVETLSCCTLVLSTPAIFWNGQHRKFGPGPATCAATNILALESQPPGV